MKITYRKIAVLILILLTAIIALLHQTLYIELGKHLMFITGKVSNNYIEYVLNKRGETKIHEIVSYGESINKIDTNIEIYKSVAMYYKRIGSGDATIEMFCSRLKKSEYSPARQIGWRVLLERKKSELERIILRKLETSEEIGKRVDALIRSIMITDNPLQNIDLIQDVSPLLTDKNNIYMAYSYMINFYQNSNDPYGDEKLKIFEDDLKGRLNENEIDSLFGRRR